MSFYGVTDLSTFIIGATAIVLLPGPNSLYVLTLAAQHGVKRGYQGAYGIFMGDAILILLTALGAASVMRAWPLLFAILTWAGGAYLVFLGYQLLRGAWQRWRGAGLAHSPDADPPDLSPLHHDDTAALHLTPAPWWDVQHPFARALMVSLVNPKAILFLLSFFVQFVDPAYPYAAVPFLILAISLQSLSFMYLSALIWGGQRLSALARGHQRISGALTALVGLMFVGYGLKLASSWISKA